jgi:hypothetical protein
LVAAAEDYFSGERAIGLRPVEVPAQAVQVVPGAVGLAFDPLACRAEGADQGLRDDRLEVLKGGIANDVEHLGHDRVAVRFGAPAYVMFLAGCEKPLSTLIWC